MFDRITTSNCNSDQKFVISSNEKLRLKFAFDQKEYYESLCTKGLSENSTHDGTEDNNQEMMRKLLRYYSIQLKYGSVIDHIKSEKGAVKVAFLVIFDTVFPYWKVFESMCADPVFDPYIVVIPNVSRSHEYLLKLLNTAFNSFHELYGGRVIKGYDEQTGCFYDLGNTYQIVFFSNPYKALVNEKHHIEYFLDRDVLTVYTNYGFETHKYWKEVVSTDFYNYVWKACVETYDNFNYLKENEAIKGYNAIVTGYLKADWFYRAPHPVNTKTKTIIISPHHSVLGSEKIDTSNFLKYYDFFIELPRLYPEIQFIFRPHPLLFTQLLSHDIWSENQIEEYLSKLLSMPNMKYDQSSDYSQLFLESDALIHDCISFMAEYLFIDKPCCYMMKTMEETMNCLLPIGKKCINQHYQAFSEGDIISFIDDVVIGGNDYLSQSRHKFFNDELKLNYPDSSSLLIDYLKIILQR